MACNSANENSEQLISSDTSKSSVIKQGYIDRSEFILDTTVASSLNCDTTEQINKTLKLVTDFDKASIKFHLDTFTVIGKTNDNFQIIAVNDRTTEYVKFYGKRSGAMGESKFCFYILNGSQPKICSVILINTFNDNQKDSNVLETITDREIYCNNKLIAVLDDKLRKKNHNKNVLGVKEKAAFEFFKDYIGQIKIKK